MGGSDGVRAIPVVNEGILTCRASDAGYVDIMMSPS